MRIFISDSTLCAAPFSLEDKLRIARRLDGFGLDYIEAGRPAAPSGAEFFARARELRLAHARLTARGEVARRAAAQDPCLRALLEAGTPTVSVEADSWDLLVCRELGFTDAEWLSRIADTVRFLASQGREVIFRAGHFFDGWHAHRAFASRVLETARQAGAAVLCLCDSNGGSLTGRVVEICAEVRKRFDGVLGVAMRNDAELAVANTLAAIELGFTLIGGTINGYGERCGEANLCSVLPGLELKLGHTTVWREKLEKLHSLAHFVADAANLSVPASQPYVGRDAFAGMNHEEPAAGAHTLPEQVGNRRPSLVAGLVTEARRLSRERGQDLERELADRIASLEAEGYDIQSAGGTFELLVREAARPGAALFDIAGYEVTTRRGSSGAPSTTATVTLRIEDAVLSATAEAPGPVHALDLALRKGLSSLYPAVSEPRLADYKVRVLDSNRGTASRVRVLVEWSAGDRAWATAGISDNVIDASWRALVDAMRLELLRAGASSDAPETRDYSWAV